MKKLNKIFNCSALAVATMTLWAGSAQATSINFLNTAGGLYSTGVNSGGTMLTDNNADSHYSYAVTTGADAAAAYAAIGSYSSPSYSVTSANVGGTNVAQTSAWVGYNTSVNSAVSSGTGATVTSAGTVANSSTWISTNTTGGDTVGSYFTFRTSFTLTGFDLNSVNISGLWASDNRGRGIYLNGVNIATLDLYGGGTSINANYGVSALASFSISGFTSLLHTGVNTLDFETLNSLNPGVGVRVQFDTASGNPVPEPVSLWLLAIGAAGLGMVRRKKA